MSLAQESSSRKRPYQPGIAAFFPRNELCLQLRDSSPTLKAGTADSTTSALQRLPPSYVQSSLISVGMRIRKAVPSGYQRESKEQVKPFYKPTSPMVISRPSELQPYASSENGLHAVGGWGVQSIDPQMPSYMNWGPNKENDPEPHMPSTQGPGFSNHSTNSLPAQNAKRRWVQDDLELESSPSTADTVGRSAADAQDAFRTMMQQRAWARPRTRKTTAAQQPAVITSPMVIYQDVPDFEEADFLSKREEVMDLS